MILLVYPNLVSSFMMTAPPNSFFYAIREHFYFDYRAFV